MDPVYRIVISVAKALFKFQDTKITLSGVDNVPPQGGMILASNHIGFMDFVYVAYPVWVRSHRYTRFLTKQEAFQNKVAGWLLRKMKHIPVDRADGSTSYAAALEYLARGEVIGIFPEGTISRSFEPKEFKTGTARLALEAQVPIVPVAIWGTQRIMTSGNRKNLGRSHIPLAVSVGKPIYPQGTAEDLTARTKLAVEELLTAIQAKYPVAQPAADLWWQPQRLGGTAPSPEQVEAEDVLQKKLRKKKRQDAQNSVKLRDDHTDNDKNIDEAS